MSRSSVPAVIAALAALPFTVPVFIGEPTNQQGGDFNAICWAGPEHPAAPLLQSISTYSLVSGREQYDVVSQFLAWQGSADLMPCITRVYAQLDILADALAADQTLGKACTSAVLAEASLSPDQTDRGAVVTLSVRVAVTSFRDNA